MATMSLVENDILLQLRKVAWFSRFVRFKGCSNIQTLFNIHRALNKNKFYKSLFVLGIVSILPSY